MRRRFRFLPPVVGSYRQSPPRLQRIFPRVGDNVVRLITRERHECFVSLLQHNVQVLHSSVLVRVRRQALEINCCRRDFRRLFSGPLQHHLRLVDHTSEECLRLLRPLLEIFLTTSELLLMTEAFHIDETRSVFPNLSWREIVDCSHCTGKSRFCRHLSYESEQLLLKLCNCSIVIDIAPPQNEVPQVLFLRFTAHKFVNQPRSSKRS